jgi:penicillin-binding protein 1A
VAKFASWFKERWTKSNTDAKEPGTSPGVFSENEHISNKENSVPSQVKRWLPFGILGKLPGAAKPLYRRYWFWAGLGLTGSVIAVSYGVSSIDRTLPDKAEINSIIREQTLTIKANDDTILQQQGEATREPLKLEEIPDNLKKAFIASEDRRFEKHNGVDAQGIARAALSNLRSQNVTEGGSTITQQLARILFLKQEQTMWRKVKEARLAQKMEAVLSKDQILERYLNLVYLGSGAYGVADAAHVYFSKSVSQLSLTEMATIAGLAPAPSKYSPQVDLKSALFRRNLVLQRMQEDGVITNEQKQEAVSEELILKPSPPKRLEVQAPYFTTYIQKELPKLVSPEVLKAGGLTVETTLNPIWQKAAENAVAKTLRNQGRWENFKQAALVAIDPRTGEIRAMVGGKDFGKYQFNRVTQAQRQPGSTFKGFVYATAIASGLSPYDSYLDAPLVVDGYEPKNYDSGFRGNMTMREALTKSINIVAVKVLMKVGFDPTINLAHEMGIKSELKPTYSLALGSNEVNLLELTSAYGSFATTGLHTEAHGIRRILNRRGEVVWTSDTFTPKRVLDVDSAAIMTWMLRNVVESGTGGPAQLDNRAVAGKTGTSDEARDLWFIGYIPQVVAGVWLGNDNNKPTDGSSGSAAYTWHEFMEEAVKGMSVEKFPERPKLEGRKGTIKAKPVKAKRIINRAAPDKDDPDSEDNSNKKRRRTEQGSSDDNNNDERPSRRRRSRRSFQSESSSSSQQEDTPRRSRRRSRQEDSDNTSTIRSGRRSRRQESNSFLTEGESSRSRRRSRSTDDSSSPQPRSRRRSEPSSSGSNNSPASSDPPNQPSWRERLRPDSSSQ